LLQPYNFPHQSNLGIWELGGATSNARHALTMLMIAMTGSASPHAEDAAL
jgi:hypothetical protein